MSKTGNLSKSLLKSSTIPSEGTCKISYDFFKEIIPFLGLRSPQGELMYCMVIGRGEKINALKLKV